MAATASLDQRRQRSLSDICHDSEDRVVGYYALAAGAVERASASGKVRA
jgi:hypothetical protein